MAYFEKYIAKRHRRADFLLLRTLVVPGLADSLLDMKECRRGRAVNRFIQDFNRLITSDDAVMTLVALLLIGFFENVRVETWHAIFHRLTKRLGTQSARPSFVDVAGRSLVHHVGRKSDFAAPWSGDMA